MLWWFIWRQRTSWQILVMLNNVFSKYVLAWFSIYIFFNSLSFYSYAWLSNTWLGRHVISGAWSKLLMTIPSFSTPSAKVICRPTTYYNNRDLMEHGYFWYVENNIYFFKYVNTVFQLSCLYNYYTQNGLHTKWVNFDHV